MSIKENFAQLLYANLQGSSPVDTGNMKGRITFTKYGPDTFEITVSLGVLFVIRIHSLYIHGSGFAGP
jgi:hypothetical protein